MKSMKFFLYLTEFLSPGHYSHIFRSIGGNPTVVPMSIKWEGRHDCEDELVLEDFRKEAGNVLDNDLCSVGYPVRTRRAGLFCRYWNVGMGVVLAWRVVDLSDAFFLVCLDAFCTFEWTLYWESVCAT